jgi:hypothetical protein
LLFDFCVFLCFFVAIELVQAGKSGTRTGRPRVQPNTQIIKLPSRGTIHGAAQDHALRPEQYKDLVAAAAKVDPELATVISSWPRLPRPLKDALLEIVAVRS